MKNAIFNIKSNNFLKLLSLISLFLFLPGSYSPCGILLSPPQKIDPSLLEKECGKSTANNCWRFSSENKGYTIGYVCQDDKIYDFYFNVKYKEQLPDALSKEEKAQFVVHQEDIDGVATPVYVYHYGVYAAKVVEFGSQSKQVNKGSEQQDQLEKSLQRNFKCANPKPKPKLIDAQKCADLINNKSVLFFTGAGISFAAKIPTQQKLFEQLNFLSQGEQFAKDVISNPQKTICIIEEFHRAARQAQPTAAHYALAKLAQHKSAQVMTGNFDKLHQKTGIDPYSMCDEKDFWRLQEDLTAQIATKIDFIICIGTSYDFKAVLGLYKKLNPNGTIISINKEQPDYLGDEDYLLQGDIQELVPILADLVVDNK